ncbi:hypothetical protein Corgl_1724 [Coriobacterium glomerans PW2]|uniref:Uncharacterized protein n=1 Tax=Coriobacterium glomerans (strain ATCC 49209 / DSM 20642 / JCM 10262 / PW2) TaxID=700015 RepID=F2NB69_CORGP|nr:hypothetical protein [Coriobacterium glomerans]AEB07820.1 hypothetical protein Corgl_1724 [Coriobacterium glomerans PW2]
MNRKTISVRMHALAASTCFVWLIQTTAKSLSSGSPWTPADIFFCLSILIAAVYMSTQAFLLHRND